MIPPTAAVAAQMDALQRNDWPDTDAGIRTAYLFSKPFDCERLIAGQVRFRSGMELLLSTPYLSAKRQQFCCSIGKANIAL